MDMFAVISVLGALSGGVLGYGPYVPASKMSPKCFECNYSPGAQAGYRWQALSRAGYPSCALRHPTDAGKVDKHTCGSGVCFIRAEANGLVYRGCADPHVLPWGVTPAHQCTKQGPGGALWWFCIGNLCNFGENPCGKKPAGGDVTSGNATSATSPVTMATTEQTTTTTTTTTTTAPPTTTTTTQEPTTTFKSVAPSNGGKSKPYEKTMHPSGDYKNYMFIPYNYYEYDYKYEEDAQAQAGNGSQEMGGEEEGEEDSSEGMQEDRAADPYNPCDGECKDNPSGLFPHPDKLDYFIQCGFDHPNGHACSCCKPFYRRCSPGTEFDDTTKVCTKSSSHHGQHKQVVGEEDGM